MASETSRWEITRAVTIKAGSVPSSGNKVTSSDGFSTRAKRSKSPIYPSGHANLPFIILRPGLGLGLVGQLIGALPVVIAIDDVGQLTVGKQKVNRVTRAGPGAIGKLDGMRGRRFPISEHINVGVRVDFNGQIEHGLSRISALDQAIEGIDGIGIWAFSNLRAGGKV